MLPIFTGKNCVLLNWIQEFIEIETWLLPNFFTCWQNDATKDKDVNISCLRKNFWKYETHFLLGWKQNLFKTWSWSFWKQHSIGTAKAISTSKKKKKKIQGYLIWCLIWSDTNDNFFQANRELYYCGPNSPIIKVASYLNITRIKTIFG